MDKAEKERILKEMGGIPENFYDDLVQNLIKQTHEQISKIKEALGKDNYDGIRESAHFTKGSAGNLRINTIYEIAKSMELASLEKKSRDDIASDLKKLEEALSQLEEEVQNV